MDNMNMLKIIEKSFVNSAIAKVLSNEDMTEFQNILDFGQNGYFFVISFYQIPNNEVLKHSQNLISIVKNSFFDSSKVYISSIDMKINVIVTINDNFINNFNVEKNHSIYIEHLSKKLYDLFHQTVTIGCGELTRIDNIANSYFQAIGALYNATTENNIAFYRSSDCNKGEFLSDDYYETLQKMQEEITNNTQKSITYFSVLLNIIEDFDTRSRHNRILEILTAAHLSINTDKFDKPSNFNYYEFLEELQHINDNDLNQWSYSKFSTLVHIDKPYKSVVLENKVVKSAREYLEENYVHDISLEDISKHVNISPQYFSKLIKKTTGYNFVDWLSTLRVKKAKELFRTSGLTIKEVCFLVGYKDPNYFSRIFKKRAGMTPTEYIHICRGNNINQYKL